MTHREGVLRTLFAAAVVVAGTAIPVLAAPNSPEAFLNAVQESAFGYFWDECGTNGLVRDRMSDKNLSSPMAGGFHLAVLCVGVERGWITREQGAEKTLRALQTYQSLPRFHGMFAHSYDIESGGVAPCPDPARDGADVLHTGFLMAGMLTCMAYFDADSPAERAIRVLAGRLYEEVEWDWMLKDDRGQVQNTLSRHWSPSQGFAAGQRLRSDEDLSASLTYLLAVGSPTHPIPPECWNEGWTRDYAWMGEPGREFVACPPLSAHQHAHAWIDFRNRQDRFADYFRNSIRATRANREDAVLAPAAAAGSIVFTPAESVSALRRLYDEYGDRVWGKYGLYGALSPKHSSFSQDYAATQQGLIVLMIENRRSGLVWRRFMKNRSIQDAMTKAGFVCILDDFEPAPDVAPYNLWESSEHYRHELSPKAARAGGFGLSVTYAKRGNPDATLVARPAHTDFTAAKYLSLWLAGTENLGIRLADASGRQVELTETGRLAFPDGWAHVFYALEAGDGFHLEDVASVGFVAEPGDADAAGTFALDAVGLTSKLDLHKPDPVTGLAVRPTRMPGEVHVSWSPTGDDGSEGRPFRYMLRYSDEPIGDDDGFRSATPFPAAARNGGCGAVTGMYVSGLHPGSTYHVAVRAEDLAHNMSDVRSSASVTLPRTKRPPVFVLEDFDAVDAGVLWSSSSPCVRLEPTEAFALKGARSLKITYDKRGDGDAWAHIAADMDFRDLSGYRYLTMWVYGRAQILAKLWNGEDRQEDISTQTSSLADGWSPLTFDLTALERIDRTAIARLLLFVEPGKTDCGGTIYLDTIELSTQRR